MSKRDRLTYEGDALSTVMMVGSGAVLNDPPENARPTEGELNAYLDDVFPLATSPTKFRRPWNPGWDIKIEDDLARLLEQCETVKQGTGAVLRLKEPHEEQQADRGSPFFVEHEVDAEPEKDLEPDPFWEKMGERGEGARSLFEVGLKKPAFRYADCMTRAEKLRCPSLPDKHKFYKHYHCMNRFCKYDGPLHRARLRAAYEPALVRFFRDAAIPRGYLLSRLNLSKRCHGEVPTAEGIRMFNEVVGRALGKAVREILTRWASQHATRKVVVWNHARNRPGKDGKPADQLPVQVEVGEALKRRKTTHACLFVNEFGYETRGHLPDEQRVAHGLNLHAHGLLLTPFLPKWKEGWEVFRDAWREETRRAFGEVSHGCYLTHLRGWRRDPVRVVKHALNHCFKYISKMPYETNERMAMLEKAFHGARRVHAVGLWFGLAKEAGPPPSLYCPLCAKEGRTCRLYLCRRLLPDGREIPDYWPVSLLEAEGWLDLEKLRSGSAERGPSP
jgi:hypothetical protein